MSSTECEECCVCDRTFNKSEHDEWGCHDGNYYCGTENECWADRVIHIDEKGKETIYTKEEFFDNEHCRYATDQNPENCPMINDWCDENNYGGGAESEDEDLDICGRTGREFDKENPHTGCGEYIGEDDENIMVGNISFCETCGEKALEDEKKDCSHKWECGCKKQYCDECHARAARTGAINEFCACQECASYYTYRNDNCRCGGRDCPYCK